MGDPAAGKGPPSAVMLAFSALTHILLLAPVIYILVLSFGKYSFFTWHPICMSVGVGLLITEAVFTISGEAYIVHRITRANRVTMHLIMHAVGLTLVLIGLIIIVVNKVDQNRHHFATPHSILGLISIILASLAAVSGIITNNSGWLYPRVKPVMLKIVHAFGGTIILILLLASIITGTYTGWWPGSDTGRSLVFASFFIAGFLILLKPVLGVVSRSKVVFGPPPTTA